MKKLLVLAIIIVSATSAKCQEIMFKMSQAASTVKDNKTGKFTDAEVRDYDATILLQNNKVLVESDKKASYTLNKKGAETKISKNVISYSYNGKDEKNTDISFVYTINLHSKEVIVEFANNDAKSYYFGTYTSSDLTRQQ